MFNFLRKRDFITEALEIFKENRDKENLYLLIYTPDDISFKFYGEVIHCHSLEKLTGKKVNYLNQLIFILNFDRHDNEDIDNFYRFENSELKNEFEQISENRFMLDLSPSISSINLSKKIRTILNQVYNTSISKKYLVDLVILNQDCLPNLHQKNITSNSPNSSFAWGDLKL